MPLQNMKRVKRDLEEVFKNDSYRLVERIYISIPSETNIAHIKALIVGPKDTPYDGGFFFFDIKIPDNYPQTPPAVKMETLDQSRSVRFNPNLYVDGKVCLSIIGTWSGPSWTPAMSLSTVLTSIQSLMSEQPYKNEPGHESATDKQCEEYNDCIRYYALDVAVIGQLNSICEGYGAFKPIIQKILVADYESHKKRATALKDKMQGKTVTAPCPFNSMKAVCDYAKVLKDLEEHYKKLSPIYSADVAADLKELAELGKSESKTPELQMPDKNSLASRLAHVKQAMSGNTTTT